ncbi:MAG: response regulator [Paracoccaceae bacterium]
MPEFMPESLAAPARFPHAHSVAPGASLAPTMLLVEDSRFAAEAVRLICQRAGIRLRRAETLASARVHIRVYRPEIALIDLGLPDGSGLELIAQLAADRRRPGRIVAISGDSSLEGAALQRGADAFVLKPFSLNDHLAILTGETVVGFGLCEPQLLDQMALQDDLRQLRGMLQSAPGRAETAYAGQFLSSVGRMMGRTSLASAAAEAGMAGDPRRLHDLLAHFTPGDDVL